MDKLHNSSRTPLFSFISDHNISNDHLKIEIVKLDKEFENAIKCYLRKRYSESKNGFNNDYQSQRIRNNSNSNLKNFLNSYHTNTNSKTNNFKTSIEWEESFRVVNYTSINRNIRFEEKKGTLDFITPNSLENSFKGDSKGAVKDSMEKSEFHKPQLDLYISYIFLNLQQKFGVSFSLLQKIVKILHFPFKSGLFYWLKIGQLHLDSDKNFQKQLKSRDTPKIRFYKYFNHFCNICCEYSCNLHFFEAEEGYSDTPFASALRIKISAKTIKEKLDSQPINWAEMYRCPKQKDKCAKETYIGHPVKVKFSKFERQCINHFSFFGNTNPCFISEVLRFAKSKKTCCEVQAYIKSNSPPTLSDYLIYEEERERSVSNSKRNTNRSKNEKLILAEEFCNHEGTCNSRNCPCLKFKGFCILQCLCSHSCSSITKGCECLPGECKSNCPCVKAKIECDANRGCVSCNSAINPSALQKINSNPEHELFHKIQNLVPCPNSFATYNVKQRLLLGKSKICEGLGIFAGQSFEKGDFVGEYIGEIINEKDCEFRGLMNEAAKEYYIFTLDKDRIIDGRFYGNKTRFINHGIRDYENCFVQIMETQGTQRICLYANRQIQIGEELYFNYGKDFNVDWINEFNLRIEKEAQIKKRTRNKLSEKTELFPNQSEYLDVKNLEMNLRKKAEKNHDYNK